ncbi:hypothetical protein J3F84DRAFT_104847 [Trichoderma pleuroticola]
MDTGCWCFVSLLVFRYKCQGMAVELGQPRFFPYFLIICLMPSDSSLGKRKQVLAAHRPIGRVGTIAIEREPDSSKAQPFRSDVAGRRRPKEVKTALSTRVSTAPSSLWAVARHKRPVFQQRYPTGGPLASSSLLLSSSQKDWGLSPSGKMVPDVGPDRTADGPGSYAHIPDMLTWCYFGRAKLQNDGLQSRRRNMTAALPGQELFFLILALLLAGLIRLVRLGRGGGVQFRALFCKGGQNKGTRV